MQENSGKAHDDASHGARRLAVAGLLLAVAAGAGVALAPPAWSFVAFVGSGPPTGGWVLSDLVVGSAMCLVLVAAWGLALSGLATTLAGESGVGTAARVARLAPSGYRRLILAACGSAIVLPTLALPAGAIEPSHDAGREFPSLSGLPLPDLPTSAQPRPAARPPIVRVRTGDSLWSIASGFTGSGASDARIASYVSDLYELNQPLIGPDPDLIHPGTALTPPGGTR